MGVISLLVYICVSYELEAAGLMYTKDNYTSYNCVYYAPKFAYYAFWGFPLILCLLCLFLCFLGIHYALAILYFYICVIRTKEVYVEQLHYKNLKKKLFI